MAGWSRADEPNRTQRGRGRRPSRLGRSSTGCAGRGEQWRRREAAESAGAELDRVRRAAEEQVAQARQDAARDQAGLRAGLEAQGEEARAGLQARAERARLMRGGRAAREAEGRLAEALTSKAAAEQEARAAREQVAAARQERDEAVRGAESRAADSAGRSWTGCAGPRRSRWRRPARTPRGTRPGCGPGWKHRARRPGPGFRPAPSTPRLGCAGGACCGGGG